MRQPDEFDVFYQDTRERLLAQTYALSSDLGASRRAVRDAFVVAWHRWRKLSGLESPESVVRPHAWRLAQRRSSTRARHREQDPDPEVQATLDALDTLTMPQRKALLLTHLAAEPLPQMAREIGLPVDVAEREQHSGAAVLALVRGVETVALPSLFEQFAASVTDRGRWPRATIVRRAGAARRRTHTALGAAGAVAVLVVGGSLVTDASGVRPTLTDRADPSGPTTTTSSEQPASGTVDEQATAVVLPEESLLGATEVGAQYSGRRWSVQRTSDNSTGNGLALPCQAERYADPRGDAALVRTFEASAGRDQEPATGAQLSEASATPRAAARAFRTTTSWFAGCADARVQLLSTATPDGVGDEAVQFVLRSWTAPVTTHVVGVARTGLYTTTTTISRGGADRPDRAVAAALLSDSVNRLCAQPDAGACAPTAPEITDRDPLPAGPEPSMLSEIDLPPVARVEQPWVGTQPRRARTNTAATGCDQTSFDGAFRGQRFLRNATRTFLLPEADLPREFGLTETVAALPPRASLALVQQVRERVAGCPDRDLNTEVEEVVNRTEGDTAITVWRLDVKVSDSRSFTFWMAILRDGPAVGQVGFVPAGEVTLEPDVFVDLAERALARLALLPGPRRS